ncbi:Putative cytochrome oxidase subunit [Dickeya aquatica]|uniref:Cytochrome oxidase subunit n=2 Tax=Pectobacteriaceae TaxID=1903410 RepID=A0A375AEL4_9GAMM|nr:Putative cytochrome oxidase subunit [Dickeya aquatica]
MQRATSLPDSESSCSDDEEPASSSSGALSGALVGFCCYWLAFSLPFTFFGFNSTLLLMLYTWPFFLALMPLSVLIGMLFRVFCQHNIALMMLCCAITIPGVFWLVFLLIRGW